MRMGLGGGGDARTIVAGDGFDELGALPPVELLDVLHAAALEPLPQPNRHVPDDRPPPINPLCTQALTSARTRSTAHALQTKREQDIPFRLVAQMFNNADVQVVIVVVAAHAHKIIFSILLLSLNIIIL
jgi:hypothetical protein